MVRFLYCSALCGIIATTVEGGNIFKFEDNVCSVGTYTGVPEDFEDDQVSVSKCLYIILTSFIQGR